MTRDKLCMLIEDKVSFYLTDEEVNILKAHDAEQRATIEQQAKKIQELENWQEIVTGAGTDHETLVRMAATEYTQVAVQCWKEKCEQLEEKVKNLTAWYDAMFGAPCEEIRHQQQVEALEEEIVRLQNALKACQRKEPT